MEPTAHDRWMDGLIPRHDSMDIIRRQTDEAMKKAVAESRDETLLDHYATKGEITAVREKHIQIAEAERAVTMILTALASVNDQITKAYRAGKLDAEQAAALALGEPVPERERYTGPSLDFLRTQKLGLEQRVKKAEDTVADIKGKFRAAVHDLLQECARRCAEDYEALTRQQAWCHQQLAVAQSLVGGRQHIVDITTWNKYLVPGSPHLDVLKRNSHDEWGHVILMSAERLMTSEADARGNLSALGRQLFGNWPL